MDSNTIVIATTVASAVITITTIVVNSLVERHRRITDREIRKLELEHERKLKKREQYIENELKVYKDFVDKFAALGFNEHDNDYAGYDSKKITEFRSAAYQAMVVNGDVAKVIKLLLESFDEFFSPNSDYKINLSDIISNFDIVVQIIGTSFDSHNNSSQN